MAKTLRQTELIMGMPVTIEAAASAAVLAAVFDLFRQIDQRYGPYLASSQVRQLQQHPELSPAPELAAILADCKRYQKLTGGYFSANFAGRVDPTGYVKGWAIDQAAQLFKSHGVEHFMINAGGDILATSQTSDWRLGIQHPLQRNEIIANLNGRHLAVATSGNYERGRHIINPLTGRPADSLLSVSVIGPDIIKADVLATALFAMGWRRGQKFIDQQTDYVALFVTKTGQLRPSTRLAASLESKPLANNPR